MNTDAPIASSIVRITTGGIQNLAALIPLLSTRLCERHVTIALQKGLLYAAAAPMTIFGSLGIAQAGLIALCGSIDYPFFHGPALLRNAGFHPTGVGELLLHVKEDKQRLYKAEDKLRTILSKKKVWAVDVNLRSWDFWAWNIYLALATAALCSFGLLPYIFLIQRYLSHMPFQETWVFPLLRVCGSGFVAVNIQFLFQLRLLEETYCRLRFIAADNYLKREGKSVPTNWDPNERSKNVFTYLRAMWSQAQEVDQSGVELEDTRPGGHSPKVEAEHKERILSGFHKLRSFEFWASDNTNQPSAQVPPAAGLPPGRHRPQSRSDTAAFDSAEQASPPETRDPPEILATRADTTSSTMSKATTRMEKAVVWLTCQFTTLILWGTQLSLFFGIVCTVVGYIGCFTVVQANQDRSVWKGSLVWFVCEVALSSIRTMIWAANPDWDDAKLPIVLEKVPPNSTASKERKPPPGGSSSYGVGWALDSPTADDMHALIIGISDSGAANFEDLDKARSDANSFKQYLEEYLLVPRSQIRTLYDSEATRNKIEEELKSLGHRGSVTEDAPIVIYFAGHSFLREEDECTYLVPHLPWRGEVPIKDKEESETRPEDYFLPYSVIVDLLRHVAEEKTDNIVVILDSCHAGAMGVGAFDSGPGSPKSPFLSHRPSKSKSSKSKSSAQPSKHVEEEYLNGLSIPVPAESSPSTSRASQTFSEDLHSTTLTGQPYTVKGAAEELDAANSQLTQAGELALPYRGKRRKIEATTEILIGHSSHLLLAATAATQRAYEDPDKGGKFTHALLDTLKKAQKDGELQRMTYRNLMEEILVHFKEHPVKMMTPEGPVDRTLLEFQTALCTTIYQDRHLFDGLFTRKVDNTSARPVMKVLYSD